MTRIINLTLHEATAGQAAAGLVDATDKADVQHLLNFETCPDRATIEARATLLAQLAHAEGAEAAMLGGAPYLMAPLERALAAAGIKAVYAFSLRDSVEVRQADGSNRKTQVFRHAGWVWA
jgi:hypothetical protein